MSERIALRDYPKYMKINSGETIFVSSDVKKMVWEGAGNHRDFDLNPFIDGLIEAVGSEGTVIFPTYNWDFCGGKTFDIRTSPCQTGTLGTFALKRTDFARTKHPLYSFAVYGKRKSELVNMTNKDSFGEDSPFAFFKNGRVKNYVIDVCLQHCFTFVHYVEEQSGCVNYRYLKDFSAGYIDERGIESERTYSMFVRKLELDVENTIDPIEPDLVAGGAEEIIKINSSEIKIIDFSKAYDIILKDIVENKSRKICTYLGQEDEV